MGISQALIEKITRKKHNGDILAKDIYLRTDFVNQRIMRHVEVGNNVLIEGSQGALLSLNHGIYPYVTSFDVTPTAVLGQIGIGFQDVRNIYMLFRYNPIRVSGKSGRTGATELSWEDVRSVSNDYIPSERIMQRGEHNEEIGKDRVFKWSWCDFDRAITLGAPTKLILTHTDWAPREEWYENVLKRVTEMEERASRILGRHTPVSFIRTGERVFDYIETGK